MRFLALATFLGVGQAIAPYQQTASCPTTNLQVMHEGTPLGELKSINGSKAIIKDVERSNTDQRKLRRISQLRRTRMRTMPSYS
jgi:glycerate-2-kinase